MSPALILKVNSITNNYNLIKNTNGKITSEGIFVNKELNASNTDGINTTNMRGLVTNNASININNGQQWI